MSNSQVYPYTGNSSSSKIPLCGIEEFDEAMYRGSMDAFDALRRNLTALMDAARDGLRSGPPGVLQLEAETDIGKSTLYRILDPREKNPTQLDKLELIAQAYGLQAWQLLVPRLDPLDAPVTVGGKRMALLQSVFGQTYAAAASAIPEEKTSAGSHPSVKGYRGAGDRARSGRDPSEPEYADDDGRPPRRRGRPRAA